MCLDSQLVTGSSGFAYLSCFSGSLWRSSTQLWSSCPSRHWSFCTLDQQWIVGVGWVYQGPTEIKSSKTQLKSKYQGKPPCRKPTVGETSQNTLVSYTEDFLHHLWRSVVQKILVMLLFYADLVVLPPSNVFNRTDAALSLGSENLRINEMRCQEQERSREIVNASYIRFNFPGVWAKPWYFKSASLGVCMLFSCWWRPVDAWGCFTYRNAHQVFSKQLFSAGFLMGFGVIWKGLIAPDLCGIAHGMLCWLGDLDQVPFLQVVVNRAFPPEELHTCRPRSGLVSLQLSPQRFCGWSL